MKGQPLSHERKTPTTKQPLDDACLGKHSVFCLRGEIEISSLVSPQNQATQIQTFKPKKPALKAHSQVHRADPANNATKRPHAPSPKPSPPFALFPIPSSFLAYIISFTDSEYGRNQRCLSENHPFVTKLRDCQPCHFAAISCPEGPGSMPRVPTSRSQPGKRSKPEIGAPPQQIPWHRFRVRRTREGKEMMRKRRRKQPETLWRERERRNN